ncbi:alpha/beta fold hydrolase [Granulicella sibirica]|uniref:Putative hydrolase n=1 Tax=Granulicella sibirica TaxID=2479048 RepID=A0A4Q0T0M4_9BACT|nr:alpha/beta hydrolase [Granulicella sibirica]RXH55369.1 putative hydrolase [Granulicella sibirica]
MSFRLLRKCSLQILAKTIVFLCVFQERKAEAATQDLSVGSHFVELRDIRLHFVVAGQGPYVFVISPGWGLGSIYLQSGLAPLERHFTLIFMDERGNGESSRPNDSMMMSTATMANDLEHVRQALGLETINLLGHSQGGEIALDYAERYPDRVGKLALIDPEVMDDRAGEKTRAMLAALKDDSQYKTAVDAVFHAPSLVDNDSFSATMNSILPLYFSDPQRQVPVFKTTLTGTHLSAFAQNARHPADLKEPRKQSEEYGRVHADTLIVNGDLDWYCPIEVARRMKNGIANSALIEYQGVGHFPWIEEPKRFFSDIEKFFRPAMVTHE